MQVTREPLNSRWSSFSTATFKSLAVSNSTNLVCVCVNEEDLSGEPGCKRWDDSDNPPSTLFAAGLRVDHIQSGLTSEIFEILEAYGESRFQEGR